MNKLIIYEPTMKNTASINTWVANQPVTTTFFRLAIFSTDPKYTIAQIEKSKKILNVVEINFDSSSSSVISELSKNFPDIPFTKIVL